ncbi:MAG: hypothetical protein K8I03_10865 [Ignavibacteria bacterium]|nr:hypothetical protein [Ignavibacteria bacterium]
MKKIKTNSVTAQQMLVLELHTQAIDWLKRHLYKFYTPKPLTRHDAMCPASVESDPIGKRPVRQLVEKSAPKGLLRSKHVAINPEMTRVIAPFKKVVTHMN